jgi:carboxypeptidase C (cathepsin A)
VAAARRAACTILIGLSGAMPAAAADRGAAREIVTTHRLELPGRTLAFRAVVGVAPVLDSTGRVEAQAGLVAFLRDGDPAARPVTFVVNGGPGASSAYLNLGALGPWRVALDRGSPSVRAPLVANAETWLDLTDLVFIDPPGTGSGRVVAKAVGVRDRLWSVAGDIDALAGVVARWLIGHDRLGSPKVILGQSYGGLRAPRIADVLRTRQGVAVNALILLSPVLDYGWRYQARTSPLSFATLLPSFAAARLEREGSFSPEALTEVEAYAAGDFMADFLRGPADPAAVERIAARVAAITGLPIDVVRAARGRVNEQIFEREAARASGRVVSSYDASVAGADPDPTLPRPDFADPFMGTLKAPLTAAMAELLHARLGATSRAPYDVSSEAVFDAWDWGRDGGMPEAVTALRKALALDAKLQLFVAHGYTDLQAPYFETKLILDQLPAFANPGRIVRRSYPGGHVFYSRDGSRRALRRDAEALFAAIISAR